MSRPDTTRLDRQRAEVILRRRAAVAAFVLLLAMLAAAWVSIRHAPFYLPRIGPPAVTHAETEISVFGYATLTNPLVRLVVVGRVVRSRPAHLDDYAQFGRSILPAPGEAVSGRLFEVSAEELHRLDRYERRGERYERVGMALRDGTLAQVYLRLD